MTSITLKILITHHHGGKDQLSKTQENHTFLHTLTLLLKFLKVKSHCKVYIVFFLNQDIGKKNCKQIIRQERKLRHLVYIPKRQLTLNLKIIYNLKTQC